MNLTHLLVIALCLAAAAWGRPIQRGVVVGGGPAGLSAAITLRKLGLDVVLLEARDREYSRQFHMGLRSDAVQMLDEMGALEALAQLSGYSQNDLTKLRTDYPSQERDAATMLADPSVLVVRVSDLEKVLAARAIELGVDYRADSTMDFSRWPEGSVATGKMDIAGGFHPQGEPARLGPVDLIVAAEGTKSPIREHLGIAFHPEGPSTWFTGLLWERRSPDTYQRWVREKPAGFRQHITLLGHRRYSHTWALVELDPKAAGLPKEQRTAYAFAQVSEVLGETVSPDQLIWGGLFSKVQNRRAQRVAVDPVVIVGEAARAGFAWSSAGANLGIVSDSRGLTHLVEALRADRPGAFEAFEKEIQQASDAWLQLDINEFSRRPAGSD